MNCDSTTWSKNFKRKRPSLHTTRGAQDEATPPPSPFQKGGADAQWLERPSQRSGLHGHESDECNRDWSRWSHRDDHSTRSPALPMLLTGPAFAASKDSIDQRRHQRYNHGDGCACFRALDSRSERLRLLRRNRRNVGIDHPPTDPAHAMREPMKIPYDGIDHITIRAYTATLTPPSIIGPAAPCGTVSPCASQRATILVKKMAGNTAARPANKG